jgi:apolipoprotein N-acyltransferase
MQKIQISHFRRHWRAHCFVAHRFCGLAIPHSEGLALHPSSTRQKRNICNFCISNLFALLAGALLAASLAWPTSVPQALAPLGLVQGQPLWWGACLAMTVLAGLLDSSQSWRTAALRGWLFATAWLACTFGWLFTSMHTYGGLSAPLALLAVIILAGFLAIYYAFFCGLYKALAPVNQALSALCFVATWLLAELARGVLLSGFGWGSVGYTQLDGPLAGWLAWLGVYGCGAFVASLAALLALAWRTSNGRRAAGLALGSLALLLSGTLLPQLQGASAGLLNVTLLQGNIAQEEKFEASSGVPKALRWYGEQLQASRSALIITPETALALLPEQLPDGYWQALQQRFATGEQAALVGIPLGSYTEGYTNSVVGLKPGQAAPWRYDKHHLVPFGEFIPPFFRWFTNLMHIPLGDFSRGALPQPSFEWQGQRLAATICYENLFTEELATQFADAALAPTILFNISNMGWFGESLAMNQHLQIARMRALEFGRPFLLATNTGQTAIVNYQGKVTHLAQAHVATALHGVVEGRTGFTPYAGWVSQFGLWPLWLFGLGVLGALHWTRKHRSL